jgi:ankyrin repeat protein
LSLLLFHFRLLSLPPPAPLSLQFKARIEADKARGKFLAGEKAAVEIVRAFVSKQYLDVNERNGFGATPLHLAARDGVAELVTFMLENGAEVWNHTKKIGP